MKHELKKSWIESLNCWRNRTKNNPFFQNGLGDCCETRTGILNGFKASNISVNDIVILFRGIHMSKYMIILLTALLLIVQLGIVYLWIFDWRHLVTQAGLIIWISSIVLGILLYFTYSKSVKSEKFIIVSRKVVFSSTLMTIILAILALVIEAITKSMP